MMVQVIILIGISIYLRLKSIDNLFLKSILHIDGFDKTEEPFNEL
jgi:hypothetical protein